MTGTPKRTYLLFSSMIGSPNPGGGATLSLDVVEEWLRRGHKVHVIGTRFRNLNLRRLENYERSGDFRFHGVIDEKDLELGHRLNPGVAEATAAIVAETRPDIIHVHNFQGLLAGIDAALDSGRPSIYTALDFGMTCITWYLYDGSTIPCSGPEKSKCQACSLRVGKFRAVDAPHHLKGVFERVFLGRRGIGHRSYFTPKDQVYWHREAVASHPLMFSLLRRFTAIAAPSPAVRDQAARYRGNDMGIHSILYPISSGKIAPEERLAESDVLRLTFFGHSHPIKGWPFFLRVLEALPDGLNLEVKDSGGNADLFASTTSRVKRYLKSSRRAPTEEIPAIIRESDATLVPSLWHENTPLVVLETLANRRPIIASDQSGISNVVKNMENGVLLPPGDLEAWVRELTRLAREPGVIRDMRSRCRFDRTPADFVDDLEKIESCLPK